MDVSTRITPNQAPHAAKPSCAIRFIDFCHTHSTLVKVIAVSAIILGIAALATLPLSLPVLAGGAIAIATIGGFISIISSLALIAFNMSFAAHNPQNHAFREVPKGKFEEGYLKYEGNVPVLTINPAKDPEKADAQAGWIHGYLLGAQINELRNRFSMVGGLQKPEDIPHVIAKLKSGLLDQRYLKEMQGMVEGFNKWAKEQKFSRIKEMTLDEVIAFHLVSDSIHFQPKRAESVCQREQPVKNMACTSVLDKDAQKGVIFGRNMDWMSAGISGTYSLLIRRTSPQGLKTVDVIMPGLVGSLTVMNNAGLSLAMNVCPGCTITVEGMPAVFFNRRVAECCKNVAEVQKYIEEHGKPLGPYNLTVADSTDNGAVFWMNQERVSRQNKFPRWVTNYSKDNGNMFFSKDRHHLLKRHFAGDTNDKEERVRKSLQLQYVNNLITTHSVIMRPKIGSMSVAFDNSFAAKTPLQTLTREQLFL